MEKEFLKAFDFQKREWTANKVVFILLWLIAIYVVSRKYDSQPYPEGICHFINCADFINKNTSTIVLFISIILSCLYIAEKKMLFVTGGLFIISLLVFSLERSNGIYNREELFSLILLAHFIAYIRHNFSRDLLIKKTPPHNIAMYYSITVIAGSYMLAGIAKLQISGINWVLDSPNIAADVVKCMEYKSLDYGMPFLTSYGGQLAGFILNYPSVIQFLFLIALCIELLAFIAMFGRKYSFIYGCFLLSLHLGMLLLLFIKLPVFILCVCIFMLNIPGLIINKIQNRTNSTIHRYYQVK